MSEHFMVALRCEQVVQVGEGKKKFRNQNVSYLRKCLFNSSKHIQDNFLEKTAITLSTTTSLSSNLFA